MRFPLSLTTNMAGYLARKRLAGEKRFPLVLMLEPLHACNLTCTGCGRIREYSQTIKEKLTVDECLASVDECGAPIVSICGGEPMIYPEIGDLVKGILRRNKHIYLCTNGMFTRKKLAGFRPSSRFFWNVHLDGMEATHDLAVERKGVFAEAIEGIKAAKAAGFLVCTNTTIYKETDMHEIAVLLDYLTELGVDGFMMSPAYGYSAVQETNPLGAQQIFMTREDVHEKFRQAKRIAGEQTSFRSLGYPFTNYLCLAFMAGILVVMYLTPDLRLSVYLIPVWLAVLTIGYRFRQKNAGYAVRDGDWKLLANAGGADAQLYNLASDPTESTDLATSKPAERDRFAELHAAETVTADEQQWLDAHVNADGQIDAYEQALIAFLVGGSV